MGAVVAVTGATVLLTSGDARTTDSLLSGASPSEVVVSNTATPSVTREPDPTRTASPQPRTTTAPARSRTGLPAGCEGPLPPGQMADASCDEVHPHAGLPHPCIDPYHGCAWPDAHGATPGGPYSMNAAVHGNDIHVTWTTTKQDLKGDQYAGPVREFVVRLCPQGSNTVLLTRRLSTSTFSTDLRDLKPGRYSVVVQELNDSGLSSGFANDVTIVAPPTPSPSPKPSPSPSASPSPSPSAS